MGLLFSTANHRDCRQKNFFTGFRLLSFASLETITDESREYRVIRKCINSVKKTLRDDADLRDFLFSNYFVSEEVYRNIPQEQEFLNGIINKVAIAPENYHRLMNYFRQGGEKYKDIIDILEREYLGIESGPEVSMTVPHPNEAEATKQNLSKIEDCFAALVMKVAERLGHKNIDILEFRSHLMYQLHFGDILADRNSVQEIFDALARSNHWNYQRYADLENICKRFGESDSELMEWIQDYKLDLNGFRMATKMVHYMNATDEVNQEKNYDRNSYQEKLTAKYKFHFKNRSLDYVDEFWQSLRSEFLLPPCSVILEHVKKGCMEITWLVPTVIANRIRDHPNELSRVAKQQKIIEVLTEDATLYRVENEIVSQKEMIQCYTGRNGYFQKVIRAIEKSMQDDENDIRNPEISEKTKVEMRKVLKELGLARKTITGYVKANEERLSRERKVLEEMETRREDPQLHYTRKQLSMKPKPTPGIKTRSAAGRKPKT